MNQARAAARRGAVLAGGIGLVFGGSALTEELAEALTDNANEAELLRMRWTVQRARAQHGGW